MPEIKFDSFLGIHTGQTKPPRNSAAILENFDLRGLSGALESRTGYEILHDSRPNGEGLSDRRWLKFENLVIPDVGGGKEIQIVVGNAVATSFQDAHSIFTKDVFCVWASHYYNPGTDEWIDKAASDDWDWLNEIILTSVVAVHGTDLYKIRLDIVDASWISNNKFDKYVVVNLDTNEVYKIINTFDYTGSSHIGIEITSENHNFAATNKLALMRSYFPIEYYEGNSEATAKEISFVKYLNDIKIGFGGFENRVGVTVGYRKSILLLDSIEVVSLTDEQLEAFGTVNGLICSPHTALFEETAINLTPVTSGDLEADTYSFKVTGILDDLSEILLDADVEITINANYNIYFSVSLRIGTENERLTAIKLYMAQKSLNNLYQYIAYQNIKSDEFSKKFTLSDTGFLIIGIDAEEINTGNTNAASPETTTDPLTDTNWSPAADITAVADTGAGSINILRWTATGVNPDPIIFTPPAAAFLMPNETYLIDFWMKASVSSLQIVGMFDTGENSVIFQIDNTWKNYTITLRTKDIIPTGIIFLINQQVTPGDTLDFDRVSILSQRNTISLDFPERGLSITNEVGYTPSLNLVKSWDNAKLSNGRIYYVNGYIDKRNVNKIFLSNLSGGEFGGASMYDAVNATTYFNTQNYIGNDLLGIEILRNFDILALNSNINSRIDSDTGRGIDLGVASGVENVEGVVNIGQTVIYPGKFDILETDSNSVNPLSFRTVSEKYRALTSSHKSNLRAIREENKNSYRLFLGNNTSKEELILTPSGWQSAVRYLVPDCYAVEKSGNVLFMNDGWILRDKDANGDNNQAITSKFKSIPLNRDLIDELGADDLMLITDFWVLWFGTNQLVFNIYLDYSGSAYDTQTLSPVGSTISSYARPIKLSSLGPASCKTVEIELVSSPTVGYGGGKAACTILAAGIKFDIIKGSIHA